jgi:S-adenosylmethionine synthetase
MRVVVRTGVAAPDQMPYDVAERKGIGHPDSLADLVADRFSKAYSTACLDAHGVILNHWVDKVTLVGAAARVSYGGFTIDKPVDCYLFGKITEGVSEKRIDVGGLFKNVIQNVFTQALGSPRILPYVRTHINNTRGEAVDHDFEFYAPSSDGAAQRILNAESVVNDTVICVGASRRGQAGRVAIRLENLINSHAFRTRFPAAGSDVKVMVVRVGDDLDVTAAIPIHPEAVSSWREYGGWLADIESHLTGELKVYLDHLGHAGDIRLSINTKDSPGRGYLAPFGTSLGKGDCGAVGRGNRYGGVIEPLRPAGCEAPAGKNPLHHGGKIYTAIADRAARRVQKETGHYAEVTIAARNGDPLDEPAYLLVALPAGASASAHERADLITRETVAEAADFHKGFLTTDPITVFRGDGDDD